MSHVYGMFNGDRIDARSFGEDEWSVMVAEQERQESRRGTNSRWTIVHSEPWQIDSLRNCRWRNGLKRKNHLPVFGVRVPHPPSWSKKIIEEKIHPNRCVSISNGWRSANFSISDNNWIHVSEKPLRMMESLSWFFFSPSQSLQSWFLSFRNTLPYKEAQYVRNVRRVTFLPHH